MAYLLRGDTTSTRPTMLGEVTPLDNWRKGSVKAVEANMMPWYRDNDAPGAYTVLVEEAFPALSSVTGELKLENSTSGLIQQAIFTLHDMQVAVANTEALGATQLAHFPIGNIVLLACTASLQFGVVGARTAGSGTINDSAALTWGVGSVTASSNTLATTMVDMIPKTSTTLDGVGANYTATPTVANLAEMISFNGTAAAIDIFLNAAFAVDTEIDNDGILKVKGSIVMSYLNLGHFGHF